MLEVQFEFQHLGVDHDELAIIGGQLVEERQVGLADL